MDGGGADALGAGAHGGDTLALSGSIYCRRLISRGPRYFPDYLANCEKIWIVREDLRVVLSCNLVRKLGGQVQNL